MLNNFFDLTFFQSIIATIIGVGLGIPAALWVDKRIDKASELERKRKVLTVLQDELSANKLIIEDSEKFQVNEGFYIPLLLRIEAWKAFADGGELQWVKDPELLGRLAKTYHLISGLADLSNKRFNIAYFSPQHFGEITNKLNTEYRAMYESTTTQCLKP